MAGLHRLSARGTMGLRWTDAEEIAIELAGKFPGTDPLTVRFTDLHRWVTELPEFEDDPKASSEGKLEAIQMAWLEEYRANQ
jgi:FeS assembly protein IscX